MSEVQELSEGKPTPEGRRPFVRVKGVTHTGSSRKSGEFPFVFIYFGYKETATILIKLLFNRTK